MKLGFMATWTTSLLLLFLSGCIDQERTLFVRAELPDMALADQSPGEEEMCIPDVCSVGECGARLDGCGRVLDCGACSSTRCPPTFEPLLREVSNPRNITYSADEDLVFFAIANGSNRMQQLDLQAMAQTQISQTGAALTMVITEEAIYRMELSSVWRHGRPGADLGARERVVQAESIRALAGDRQSIWIATQTPTALHHVTAPTSAITDTIPLDEPVIQDLLAVTTGHVWLISEDADDSRDTLVAIDRTTLEPVPQTWEIPGVTQMMVVREEGVCVGARDELETVLWCIEGIDAPPTRMRSWNPPVQFVDIEPFDEERILVVRTFGEALNSGWLLSTVDTRSGLESSLFSSPGPGGLAPGIKPLSTDGICAYLSYQYTFQVQRSNRGDIGWLSVDAIP